MTDSLRHWYDRGYVGSLKRDHRLILIDTRGHGDSDKPHEVASYGVECRAADILSALNDLRISRAHHPGSRMQGSSPFLARTMQARTSLQRELLVSHIMQFLRDIA